MEGGVGFRGQGMEAFTFYVKSGMIILSITSKQKVRISVIRRDVGKQPNKGFEKIAGFFCPHGNK